MPAPVTAPLLQESRFNAAGGGVPVPLRLITAVPLVVELLAMVSWPVAAPVTVGSNCNPGSRLARIQRDRKTNSRYRKTNACQRSRVDRYRDSARGLRVRDWVGSCSRLTLPKPTLVALMLSVGTAAFKCSDKFFELLPLWLSGSPTAPIRPAGLSR